MQPLIAPHSPLVRLRGMLLLMRPKQWIKNGFVLAPLIFTGAFLDRASVVAALSAAILFCIASSATYILNDVSDIEHDRFHQSKSKRRPLAAGVVSVPMAIALLVVLYGVLVFGWILLPKVGWGIAGYVLLGAAYTYYLKHQPVLDIFTIALGFVLRVYVGAAALSVPLSGWMAVTTLCLALYLAAVKRRQELIQNGVEGRRVLRKYSVALVDRYAEMSGIGAIIFYSLFVMSVRPEMVVTVPLVLFGLFRYWYVVEQLDGGESPTEALLADWHLALTVVVWIALCAWIFWPAKG